MRNDRIISALLSLAIAVVFVLFITFGISTFYDKPVYEDYCNTSIEPEKVCINETEPCKQDYSQFDECSDKYDRGKDTYMLIVFVIMTLFGLGAIISSFFIPFESISTGAMGGGLLSIFIGAIRAAGNFQDWMIFIILGVVLAALIWLGYKKLRK